MLSFTALTTLNGPMAQFEGMTPKIEATDQADMDGLCSTQRLYADGPQLMELSRAPAVALVLLSLGFVLALAWWRKEGRH